MNALLETLAVTTATAGGLVAGREAQGLLEAAIRRLPESYERVVRLFDLEGLEPEAVASALDRSTGATYMLRARAHDRLRELLGPDSKFFSETA